MSWSRPLWTFFICLSVIFAACVITVNLVKTRAKPKCVENHQQCHCNQACCREQNPKASEAVPEDYICHHFDGKVCLPLSKISSLEEFVKLTKNLDDSNFLERYQLYQKSLGLEGMDSMVIYAQLAFGIGLVVLLTMVIIYYARLARQYVPVDDRPENIR